MDSGRRVTLAGGAFVLGFLFAPTIADAPWPIATQGGGHAVLMTSAVAGELTPGTTIPGTSITANAFSEAGALGGGTLDRISASNPAADPASLPVAAISVRIGTRDSIMVIRRMAVAASDDEADALFGEDATNSRGIPRGPARTDSSGRDLRTAGGTTGGVTAEPLSAQWPAQWSAVAGVGIVEPPNPARPRRDRRPVVSEIEQTPLDPDRPPHTAFDPRGQPAASGATDAPRWVASVAAPTPERDRDSDGRWADGNVVPRSENARRPAEAARRDDSRYHPPSRIARERPARQTGGFVVEADTRPASKPATQIAVAEPPGGGVAFTPRPPTPPIDAAAARDVIAAGTVEQTVIAMDPRSRGTSGEWAGLDHWRAVAPSLEGARAVSDAKAAVLAEPERHAMIVGNSITGFTRGALWTEYYAPDGTIKGIWGSTKYVARWSVSGELMCFDYPGSRNYCLMYDVDGDQALFFQQDGNGASTSFRLLTGNPYDL